jgi:hypothetical protein
MVLAAALISLAVLAPQASAQAAPQAASQAKPQAERQPASTDDSKPYTVEGVRRATAAGTRVQTRVDPVPLERDRTGYHLVLESTFDGPAACKGLVVPATCSQPWFLPANPTWHQQFLAMAGPQDYMVPYTAMSNGETLQAVVSSIAFTYAFHAIYSLIHDQVVRTKYERKQQRIEKVRTEIRGELDELERVNAAARGSGQTPVK